MSNLSTRSQIPSPLHARTADLCVMNNWGDRNGFTVPEVYTSDSEESSAILARVGLSDLSARQCWKLEGEEAAAFLSFATITDVNTLDAGQTTRTLWCDDDGRVRGEGVIVRYGKTSFELSTPVRDLGWIVDGAQGFDVSVTNATATRAVIGVKGPMAGALLAVAGFAGGPSVQASETPVQPAWRQAQVSLVRDAAGDGFELWTQADDGIVVWDRLWRSGTGLGVTAVGARVLEACRVEKGIPLVMSDWNPIQITLDAADCRLPGDLGFEPTLARRFNGVEQLRRCGVTSRSHRLVQVCADEPMVKGKLTLKQTVVGTVTSPVWSWSQNRSFAFAWLKLEHCHANVQLQAPGLNGPLSCVVARERIFQTEAGL